MYLVKFLQYQYRTSFRLKCTRNNSFKHIEIKMLSEYFTEPTAHKILNVEKSKSRNSFVLLVLLL